MQDLVLFKCMELKESVANKIQNAKNLTYWLNLMVPKVK